MDSTVFYIPAQTPALQWAAQYLTAHGLTVADQPDSTVTHLLLPIPSAPVSESLFDALPAATVIGGNLDDAFFEGRRKIDLLKEEGYLAANAAITADCAIRIAAASLGVVFHRCPVMIIGWGRIGKCLSAQLKALGACVTVAARKDADRAMATALGYETADPANPDLSRCRILFNTAPAPVLSAEQLRHCRSDSIRIDLASRKGLEGDNIIWARGLPGKMLPETTGTLIGSTILRLISKGGES